MTSETATSILDLKSFFPLDRYAEMWPQQEEALDLLSERGPMTLELSPGKGKTAIGYTVLKARAATTRGPVLFVVPTKTLVEQVKAQHPDVSIALGRNEHPCLYYPDEDLRADDIPCSLLKDCPHRVNQETGETFQPGAVPCPYLQQKYEAKQGDIVVCTLAFYLFTQLFQKEWGEPTAVVVDEAHLSARIVRNALSYEITDYHLNHCVELLRRCGVKEAEQVDRLRRMMIRSVKVKPPHRPTLLEPDEIKHLLDVISAINPSSLTKQVEELVASRRIDPKEERETLKKLEVLVRDLRRYLTSLSLSLPTPDRHPLNYVFAYYAQEKDENERVWYRLVVKAYYVAPILRKILPPYTVALSAAVNDPQIFKFETGIDRPFHSFANEFDAERTRIFVPTDTPNLAHSRRPKGEPQLVLRRIAQAARRLADQKLRSLVVVVSNSERDKFLEFAQDEGVQAISYGEGVSAKDAARVFKDGVGDVLVGTAANYAEGVDLPEEIAPIIFALRPGYPQPHSPEAEFERRRFGQRRWPLWNWRAIMEARNLRGRNVRGPSDRGVTFFISQQYRRFVAASLSPSLRPSYRGQLTFEQALAETEQLLRS